MWAFLPTAAAIRQSMNQTSLVVLYFLSQSELSLCAGKTAYYMTYLSWRVVVLLFSGGQKTTPPVLVVTTTHTVTLTLNYFWRTNIVTMSCCFETKNTL